MSLPYCIINDFTETGPAFSSTSAERLFIAAVVNVIGLYKSIKWRANSSACIIVLIKMANLAEWEILINHKAEILY